MGRQQKWVKVSVQDYNEYRNCQVRQKEIENLQTENERLRDDILTLRANHAIESDGGALQRERDELDMELRSLYLKYEACQEDKRVLLDEVKYLKDTLRAVIHK